jgi:hypothetical protein
MRLTDVRRCAMLWPEAAEQPHFQFTSFRVRGKIFATVPPEQDRLHLFVSDRVREQTLAMHPQWAHKVLGIEGGGAAHRSLDGRARRRQTADRASVVPQGTQSVAATS